MSWDEDAEKCPDEGKWCDACHDLCEGKESDCNAMEIRRMQEAIDKVKEVAEQMRFHAKMNRECDERNKVCTYLSIEADMHDEYANQIYEAIKEFVKGETNA